MSQTLLVFIGGQPAGRLTRPDAGEPPTFTYEREYVNSSGPALSARMPLSYAPYSADRVVPYLAGLLPEHAPTRQRWAQAAGASPDDYFELLSHMGLDCPGAVQFVSEANLALFHDRAMQYVERSDSHIADRLRTLARDSASWALPEEHWSLGGQQEKFALALLGGRWHEAQGAAATTHIVKPEIKALHHQALVEHATQVAAASLGLAVSSSQFVAFEDQWALVSTRYDRVVVGTSVTRLHQEDFCQAIGRMPERKYEANRGPRVADMERVLVRQAHDLSAARKALADFVIINVVAGAPDGHAKNLSLLHSGRQTRVAPLYDLASALAYDKADVDRAVALSVGGERHHSRIYAKQWRRASKDLVLAPDYTLERVEYLAARFPAAFFGVLEELAHNDVPGALEVLERSSLAVIEHCAQLMSRLE
jgi:serine/threonine-protein kinase HipA